MADDLRERLLASYAHMGEAMVIQNVLETGGVPCRVADLSEVPRHMFGIAGSLGRSVGLWVLEADVERATSLLASMEVTGGGVDEEALAAEALAAPAPESVEPERVPGDATARARRGPGSEAGLPWSVRAVLAFAVALAALLAWRGCH
jgi:Putative prokaryotic signal transducing protein